MSANRHIRRGIARSRATVRSAGELAPFRFAVMLLGLLALAVQSFVVQTHIHIPQGAGKAQSISLITLAASVVTDAAGKAIAKGRRGR
jgi:hypothetical protein